MKPQSKITLVFLLLLSLNYFTLAQNSRTPTLSVLTCGSSKALYASFGHTALRYIDSSSGVDQVYNFGTFDPGTPNFYLKFLFGKLDYSLTATGYQHFFEEYSAENRTIMEQRLILSEEAIISIYDSLQTLLKPENRNYRYDFFKNNCTTLVRDLIFYQVADSTKSAFFQEMAGHTWRQSLGSYLVNRSWLSTGINLLAGPFTDKKISRYDQMFLPDQLMKELSNDSITTTPVVTFQSTEVSKQQFAVETPMVIFWILAALLIVEALWLKTSSTFSNRVDQVIFGFSALLGFMFLCLWLLSDHISLRFNLNILWANPLNLLVVWSIGKNWKKFTKVYLFLYALLLFFLIVDWTHLPQKFPLETMPLIMVFAFRAVNQVFRFKK